MKSSMRDGVEGKWHIVIRKQAGEVQEKMAVYQPVNHQPGKGVTVMKTNNTLVRILLLLVLVVGVAACGSTSKQSSTGEYVDDSVITTKVKSQLAGDDFLKSFAIGVETYKGVVQLSGFVNTQTAVNRANEIARGVQGVSSVKNNLIIK